MNFLRIKQTIPEVFSILGGLLGFVLACTRVLMIAINKNLFEIELINKVFSDENEENQMLTKVKRTLM